VGEYRGVVGGGEQVLVAGSHSAVYAGLVPPKFREGRDQICTISQLYGYELTFSVRPVSQRVGEYRGVVGGGRQGLVEGQLHTCFQKELQRQKRAPMSLFYISATRR